MTYEQAIAHREQKELEQAQLLCSLENKDACVSECSFLFRSLCSSLTSFGAFSVFWLERGLGSSRCILRLSICVIQRAFTFLRFRESAPLSCLVRRSWKARAKQGERLAVTRDVEY